MFNPIRQLQDFNTGHAGSCPPPTNCLTPIVNKRVFNQNSFLLVTNGDVFVPHACAGVAPHIPVVIPTTCSTRVYISNFAVALASPSHPLGCGDVVVPNPTSKIFIGM
jgi:hypothetical protein